MAKRKIKKKVKKKRYPGATFNKKARPKLVGDSYQANERDLKKMRRIARRRGISKAEIIRYAVTLVLKVYEARAKGKKKFTIHFGDA